MLKEKFIGVAEGALGGLAGTLFMSGLQVATRRLSPNLQAELKGDPTEIVTRRVPESLRPLVRRSAHWLYGAVWPAVLGLLSRRLRMNTIGRAVAIGAALGAGVWAVGHAGWLPLAGLEDPVNKQRPRGIASGLVGHVAYGIISALPLALFGSRRAAARGLFAVLRRKF